MSRLGTKDRGAVLLAIIAQLVEAAVTAQAMHNPALVPIFRQKFYENVESNLHKQGIQ